MKSESDERQSIETLLKENPLDIMTQVISRTVKKEDNLIKLLILSMFSAYTPDPINLGIEGPSGEGKTHPVVEVAQLFPENDVMMLGGLSPTALVHDHGILIDNKGTPLKPIIDKKYTELESEPNKKKQEKIKREIADLYKNATRLINLNDKILIFLESPHRETWSKLRPILSHDVYETTFKFTDRIHKNGPMTTITVKMQGWPAVIYTSADAKSDGIWDQIKSRFLIVSPEMGLDKYKAAIELLGVRKGIPKPVCKYLEELNAINECKRYILALRNGLTNKLKPFYENYLPKDVNITWIPFQTLLTAEFPKTKGQRMRDFDNLLRVIQASALINAFIRPVVAIGEDEFLIITINDLKLVMNLLNRSTVFAKQGQHIINFFNDIILPLWNDNKSGTSQSITVKDMVNKCREMNDPKSEDTIRKNYLKPLVSDGIVSLDRDEEDKRRYVIQVIKPEISDDTGFFKNQLNFSIDDFNKAIDAIKEYKIEIKFYNTNFFGTISEDDQIDQLSLYQKYFVVPIVCTGSLSSNLPVKIEKYQTLNLSVISGILERKTIPLGGVIVPEGMDE